MAGILTLLATPIGNLGDISDRAVQCLSDTDFIAAEDTRVTVKLLNHLAIKKPLISYHEHNMIEKSEYIIERLLNGENCILVSDAGMPAISDPGEQLVKKCYEYNIKVSVIPGASAVVCAVAISGLNTSRFTFEGFLTVNKKNRLEHLKELENEKRTIVFYESPHKIERTLNDLYNFFGNRRISIVRELTKIHEEVIRTSLSEAVHIYDENHRPKGEFVLVMEGRPQEAPKTDFTEEEIIELAKDEIANNMSKSEVAKVLSKQLGISKSKIYKIIISNFE